MDTIAVKPAAPPPAPESQPARETKDEETSKTAAFDQALMQELAALMGDPGAAVAEPLAADAAAEAQAHDLLDTGAEAAPGLAAEGAHPLAGTPGFQGAPSALDRAAAQELARAGLERVGVERGAVERSVLERGTLEKTAVDRTATERREVRLEQRELELARGGAEHREIELSRDGGEQPEALPEQRAAPAAPAAPAPTESLLGALTGERAAAFVSPAATGLPSALDGLSSGAIASRWAPAAATAAEAAPAAASARIDTPLGTTGWGEAFQQKIVWLVDRQQQSAELHVNPPHLGPVEVMLNLGEDGARIAFCSPHAAVREAIEASLGDLQTALGERGVNLGEASVSSDAGAAREQLAGDAQRDARGARQGRDSAAAAAVAQAAPAVRVVARGLVDTFA